MLLQSSKDSVRTAEGKIRYIRQITYILNGRKAIFVKDGLPIGYYDYSFVGDTLFLNYDGREIDKYRSNHAVLVKSLGTGSYMLTIIKKFNTHFNQGKDGIYYSKTSYSKIDEIINFDILPQPLIDYYANAKLVDVDCQK